MAESKPNRFSDLNKVFDDVDNWAKVEDLVDQEIVVIDAVKLPGKYGEYIAVKFCFDGDGSLYGFSTGSQVMMKKILTAKDKGWLPLPGRVTKVKRYYDIL